MSYLIFCSFEVGGFPFRMAETLNRHGVETYYIFMGKRGLDHDSTYFHYENRCEDWDLSNRFQNIFYNVKESVDMLKNLKSKHNINHCIATGRGAYLLHRAGIRYKYWSYGSDIDQECFFRVPLSNYPLLTRDLLHPFKVFSERHQARRSIFHADSVMISPYQIRRLRKINPDKKMFFLPHYFKIIDYPLLLEQKSKNQIKICEEIKTKKYFFSSTRHVWCGSLRDMKDNKGNNVMLNAFALFKKISKNDHSKFVLINKGPDAESSKLLSRSLGIQDHVVWLDEIKREELDRYYQGAAICFGQFGTPVVTYAALEPLANGTISISFSKDNNTSVPFYIEKPPIFSNKNPKEIAEFMVKILSEKENYEDLSYKSWLWIKNNCSEEEFVKSFLKVFQER